MHFLIRCIDQPGGPELRRRNFQAHQGYLAETGKAAEILISGPLVAQDAVTVTGSAYLVEAADIEAARAFIEADPYHRAGVWESVSVEGFLKKTDNRGLQASRQQ
ncbi:YciI family protein [Variovorax paradoxus]|uniref:YciI family protein n=1 Tax=Variovorax paradoxus TaxID=34073 RepID=UPI003ECE2A89